MYMYIWFKNVNICIYVYIYIYIIGNLKATYIRYTRVIFHIQFRSFDVRVISRSRRSSYLLFSLASSIEPLTDRSSLQNRFIQIYERSRLRMLREWDENMIRQRYDSPERRRNILYHTTVHSIHSMWNQRSISSVISRRQVFPFHQENRKKNRYLKCRSTSRLIMTIAR